MRPVLLPFLAVFVLLIAVGDAHPFLQNSLWIQIAPEQIQVAINVSAKELQVAQAAYLANSEADPESLAAAAEEHRDYLTTHFTLSVHGQPLAGQITRITPPIAFTDPEKTFFQFELAYPLAGPPPAQIALAHSMLREWPYGPGQAWDVSYVVRLKRSDSNAIHTGLLRSGEPAEFPTGWETAPAAEPPTVHTNLPRTFRDYLWHGMLHILTGYDHLLFVAALVLATLSFWEMVKVIAAFTLAHTVTLTLSVFDLVRLPSWVVEPVIALSIVFVALENVFFPRRAASRLRLLVAFGFGLIHGLGFAGGLLEAMAGLPVASIWIALIAFSIGVEIGHQVVVLPLFGLLALGRSSLREGFSRWAVRYGSVLIALAGVYYLFLSVHEQFFTGR
jgi:hypothetical protein